MKYIYEIRRRWTAWWRTGNSFVYTLGSKLGLSKGSVGRVLVVLEVLETDMAVLGQEYMMWDEEKV